ncbi:hypothetical protein [Rhizobium giardinii]|jgi:hypothetical protein|uniref:Uncharacterized protein n=1 Tax=Rhizobium giardinii TaxID=56731 RepID=A0A7W8XA89_9HYPH|nr:hypothetical protein [Rhizobium giardinii]MBB5537994.1 hypothetical protein [Rhizobium giardinii]
MSIVCASDSYPFLRRGLARIKQVLARWVHGFFAARSLAPTSITCYRSRAIVAPAVTRRKRDSATNAALGAPLKIPGGR